MTLDKQNNGHLAKPFTPTLSAAFSRGTKSPLTPKLANPSTIRTPKRLAPPDHPASTPRQGPEPSLLNANVTPRSGSRASAFVQPSPARGPNPGVYRTERSPVRLGGKVEPSRTMRAKTLTADLNTPSRPQSSSDLSTSSPMFFHANDARSVSSSSDAEARSRAPVKPGSTAIFVYANGEEEQQDSVEGTAKRRLSGLSRSVVTKTPVTSPRLKSVKIHDPARGSDGVSTPQAGSHADDASEIRSQGYSPRLATLVPRPISITKHTKSSSLDTGHGAILHHDRPREGLRPSPIIISPSDCNIDSIDVVSDPIPGLRPRVFSNGSTTSLDSQGSASQSPVKSEPSNSGVLSARVERKILDLEISNSSLLAINRTLEREMRKQNEELQRYRRLSRSGRLSMAPSTRSVSGTLSIPSEVDEGISEISSNHSPEDLSDFSDEESMLDTSVLGPESTADDETQQSIRDEKRFFIDLAKHQELLADSQKMNRSLKRCLGWTEELIKEAKKALEYNVHVNDIQLGGRVLSPEELNEVGEAGRGLLAPSSAAASPDSDFEISRMDDSSL
ncbi:hypothetical protein AOCH_000868 [Aspergillus ochraceoroseus]|uniref:Uncharacterized protein n=1 Tax=Aspergillus ochraceoroseus TaxID=138278 RepID=A0A0F8X3D5_9EURO|nr:hypothetical protein AOCH_000868 [Aspergillus ochraceoroseus]